MLRIDARVAAADFFNSIDRLRIFHYRHPGEGRDRTLSVYRTGEIPAFAGMTDKW